MEPWVYIGMIGIIGFGLFWSWQNRRARESAALAVQHLAAEPVEALAAEPVEVLDTYKRILAGLLQNAQSVSAERVRLRHLNGKLDDALVMQLDRGSQTDISSQRGGTQ